MKIRGVRISGKPTTQLQQNLLEHYLRMIRQRTALKLPNTIVWIRGSRSWAHGNYLIRLSRHIKVEEMLAVLLHELVHINYQHNHTKKFYIRLIHLGLRCNLDLDKWFSKEYTRGQRFYEKYKQRTGLRKIEDNIEGTYRYEKIKEGEII